MQIGQSMFLFHGNFEFVHLANSVHPILPKLLEIRRRVLFLAKQVIMKKDYLEGGPLLPVKYVIIFSNKYG